MNERVVIKRNVFLDTQVYTANNFDFSNDNFVRFSSLVEEGKVSLFITSITLNEIKTNIINSVCDSEKAIRDFQNKARILRISRKEKFGEIWQIQNYTEFSSDIIDQVEEFIHVNKIENVPIDGLSNEEIFVKYFNNLPPFGGTNKKHEFPDAFAIAALEKKSLQIKEIIYVISADLGWKAACKDNPNIFHLGKPEELFQLIEFDEKIISEISEQIFIRHKSEIEKNVIEKFENLDFFLDTNYTGKWTDEEFIENINVERISLINKYLVNVKNDELLYKCEFEIQFWADISYLDNSEALYDKETGSFSYGENIQDTIECIKMVSVNVEIGFSREDPDDSKLVDIFLEEKEIYILLNDDDQYPYK
jgi:hypothetical protein